MLGVLSKEKKTAVIVYAHAPTRMIYSYSGFIGRHAELPDCLGFLHRPVESTSGPAPVASRSWFSFYPTALTPPLTAATISLGPPPLFSRQSRPAAVSDTTAWLSIDFMPLPLHPCCRCCHPVSVLPPPHSPQLRNRCITAR